MSNIDFGIDLGTTNSVITKFTAGEVQLFSNPSDFGRNTLPSVVGFRKDRTLVGTKAREYCTKDAKNVLSGFKRKMGTSESYKVSVLNQSKTPVELSAYILKELKSFVQSGEIVDSVVITIPASFDTIQSNATKEAGLQAGFKQVVLLQEPIAASLAFANKKRAGRLMDGRWLVYDLGGGTFDVALMQIQDGEMKVLDHEGNNFLGGMDFDEAIVKKLLIPKIQNFGVFADLENQMTSDSGRHNSKYFKLLNLAESAKIALSSQVSEEINVQIEDDCGDYCDEYITITRSEFEELIKHHIDETVDMIKRMLVRKALTSKDMQFVLLVGGSTFIPFVRKRVEELLQIPLNFDLDPTTAVAMGAAYYAATKPKDTSSTLEAKTNFAIKIKAAYQKTSKEAEEYFAAKVDGEIDGLDYRITRQDGGFDTGLRPLGKQISEDLPLVDNAYNCFRFSVFNKQGDLVETGMDLIEINSGYGISGQPLPEDICIEVDDLDYHRTKLERVFKKGTVLPVTATFRKLLNRTILRGSEDHYRINVVEGPVDAIAESNKIIGYMAIQGTQLSRDIQRGSDIELTISMSESRELTVSAYLQMSDQEFTELFFGVRRETPVSLLIEQVQHLSDKLALEISEATDREDFEVAKELSVLSKQACEVQREASSIAHDDVTDLRYQLEDRKRKLAQEVDMATKGKQISVGRREYLRSKDQCTSLVDDYGTDYEQKMLTEVVSREKAFLNTNSLQPLQDAVDDLNMIIRDILWRSPAFLKSVFSDLVENHRVRLNDPMQGDLLIEAGKKAIVTEDWEKLTELIQRLINLLPQSVQDKVRFGKIGF